MSPHRLNVVAYAAAACLGIAAGQVWLDSGGPNLIAAWLAPSSSSEGRRPREEPAVRRARHPRSKAATGMDATLGEKRPTAEDPPHAPASLIASTESVEPHSWRWESHRLDPVPPRIVLAPTLWTSPITIADASQPLSPREQDHHARLVKARADSQAVRREAGVPPWTDTPFQCFGILASQNGFCTPGGDFTVPASPERSLLWYASQHGVELSDEDRRDLLMRLETFEVERRRHANEVWRYLGDLGAKPHARIRAFLVREGQLFLVEKGEDAALDDVARRLQSVHREFFQEAAELSKGD